MKVVTITGHKPDGVMTIVKELRSQGLVQGKDFDFKYNPSGYTTSYERIESETDFTFHDGSEKYATFFILRYNGTNKTGCV